ncbi:MAG: hypothetical protein E7220_00295 [Clostridiales bacterium]|nr:hypothetical protein [Clostridiales bacterium]
MKRKWLGALLIYVALIILCLIVIYAVPSVKGLLEKTYIAEYGTLDITDEVSGYIVRDEYVYVAAQDSEVTRQIEAGQLAKAKAKVVKLVPEEERQGILGLGKDTEETAEETASAEKAGSDKNNKSEKSDKSGKSEKKSSEKKDKNADKDKNKKSDKDQKDKSEKKEDTKAEEQTAESAEEPKLTRRYADILEELGDSVRRTKKGRSKDSGYISYYVDGAESAISTDAVWDLREKDLKDLCRRKQVETADKRCSESDPVFKIVRNSKWYLVVFLNNKDAEKYYEGRSVTITTGENSFPAKVVGAEEVKRKTKVVFSCKAFYEGFFETREMEAEITAASAQGLVIQDSSIIEKDGQKGVLIKNKLGERKFRPISIKADDGNKCVVYSDIYVDEEGNFVETLANYDEVVAEPTEEDIENLKTAK